MEQWKPAFGFNAYMVSSDGRVMNIRKARGTRQGKMLRPTLTHGYLALRLRVGGKYANAYVHRLVLQSFTVKHHIQVNHLNGDKQDNRLANLQWCSAAENLMHATRVLGHRRGSKHWRAHLTEFDIPIIRQRLAAGEKHLAIASDYGVTRSSISQIFAGTTWRHVD